MEMFKSSRLVNKSFSETKTPSPQWELLVKHGVIY